MVTRPPLSPAPFPQPSPLFIGRQDELARCLRLLERSPLLLAYGVPGIGKTEFVYRLVADLRTTRRWQRAQPILLRAQAGQRLEQLVAQLGGLLSGRSAAEEPSRPTADLHGELAAVARSLEETAQTARLIFIDDVHHLDPAAVGEAASYLARRSGGSRLFIASRRELPLLPDTVPPTVVRLPPLSAAEATELALGLAELQGTSAPDAQAVFSRTGGSPRLLHRLVLRSTATERGDEDALAQTLRGLPPAARRLLVLTRILAGKLPAAEWLQTTGSPIAERHELETLTHYHLLDPTRWTVPDPVWNTLLTLVGARELKSAHRLAAQLHLRRCAGAPVGSAAAAAALSAVQHQVAAGEPLAAWATFAPWAHTFCATELGSSALALLPTLRAELPGQRGAIDLLAIRLLLSQGQLDSAQALLADSGAAGSTAAVRWQLLAGQLAQRAGQLSRAGDHFRAAQTTAATPHERFLAAVHGAELAALRGATAETERLLAAITNDAQGPVELSPAERLRLGCATARSLLLLGQPAAAAQAVAAIGRAAARRPALPAPAPRPPDDPEVTLAVLATLAHSGCGDPVAAKRALEQVCFFATATGVPTAHVILYCSGVMQLTAGQLSAAQAPLRHAYEAFVAQLNFVPAAAAAISLGSCALALGEFAPAARQLGEALRQATRAGCAPLQRLASALRASALLAAGQTEPALTLSTAVLADAEAPPRARALARSVRWRAYALAGDTAGAGHELCTATAEVERAGQEFLHWSQELEHAEFAAAYGCPRAAIEHAERAQQFFSERGLQHEVARAHLALALAHASRREPTDPALCQESLAVVSSLGARYGYGPLLLLAALVEAALAHQRGDSLAARDQLKQALADNPAVAHGLAAQPLRAALSGPDVNGWSGTTALLARLGFLPSDELADPPTAQIELRSPRGRRLLPRATAHAEHARFELTIDLERSELLVGATGRRVTGRPLMCDLLAHLVAAGPLGTDAERLFHEVWRGTKYHPLRHRNTIHVALTRLRQLLRQLLPKRELIETTASGWRLAPESNLCTLGTARS